jgi:hypothetical protein
VYSSLGNVIYVGVYLYMCCFGGARMKPLSDKVEAKLAKLKLKPAAERKPSVPRKPPAQGWRKTKKRREAGIKAYYKDLKLLLKHHKSALVPVPVEKTSYEVKVLHRQKEKLVKQLRAKLEVITPAVIAQVSADSNDKKLNKKSKITPSLVLPEVASRISPRLIPPEAKRDELNPGVGQLFSKREKSLDESFNRLKELARTELLIALTCCPWNFGQYVTYSSSELLMDSTPQKAVIRTIEFKPVSPYYSITLNVFDEDNIPTVIHDVLLSEIIGVNRTSLPDAGRLKLMWESGRITLGNSISRYLNFNDLLSAIEESKSYSPANILSPKTLALLKLLDKNGIIK